MVRAWPAALAFVLVTACGTASGSPGVQPVWDLRDSHSIEDVGWPDDMGSTFEATASSGLQTILLPGGVAIDDAEKAHPSRGGGIRDTPYEPEIEDLLITFERESIPEVMARAGDLSARLGIELGDLPAWAAANAGRVATDGGAAANSDRGTLPGGVVVRLSARAYEDGDAVLDLLVSWPTD